MNEYLVAAFISAGILLTMVFLLASKPRIAGKITTALLVAAARTHACLISWEELEDLSQWESAVTGKTVDYKQMDRDNVLAIPELIRACGRQNKSIKKKGGHG